MKYFQFLASRRFAVLLLALSAGLLVLWKAYDFYSSLFLLVPVFLFLSISVCTLKRFLSRSKRRDTGFIGSMLFHLGMLVVIASTALGYAVRFEAMAALPQDVTINLSGDDFVTVRSVPRLGELPFLLLTLQWQESRYEDGFKPVSHSAGLHISYMEGDTMKSIEDTVAINSPVDAAGYKFLLIGGQHSPSFILRQGDDILFNNFVKVTNVTEEEGSFNVEDAGLTVYTRFFPDMFKEDGRYGTRSLELNNPAFGIRVSTKEEPFSDVWKGILKVGDSADFGSYTLEFTDIKPVVAVKVIKDQSYYGILVGWLLLVSGLLMRYTGPYLGLHLRGSALSEPLPEPLSGPVSEPGGEPGSEEGR